MTEPLTIFIGYDTREADAFEVCRASLLRHASVPLHIVKLDQAALRRAGWYRREWRQEGQNRIDMGDLKPFSTDFSFSRFMTVPLSLYQGWSLFCDCDFLFTRDIADIFDLADERFAIMCVKHEHDPVEKTKMGGVVQSKYYRKNWSSFTLYNCAHPSNAMLTGYVINEWSGSWLHAFSWLRDEEIGSLPKEWNFLTGVDPAPKAIPSGIHFTLGTPDISGCDDVMYSDLWKRELMASKNADNDLRVA